MEAVFVKGTAAMFSLITESLKRSLIRLMTSGDMRKFEAEFPVSAEQQRLLTFGVVLSTYNLESCRTFRLDSDRDGIVDMLESWWGITSRKDALDTAGQLAVADMHTPEADEEYYSITKEHLDDAPEYFRCRRFLLKLGYKESELSAVKTTAAWDYGRTCHIARHSAVAGYLEEDEAWEFMRTAAENASKAYENWREYLAGYIFGRALGYGSDSADMRVVLKYILHNPKSPIKDVPFK